MVLQKVLFSGANELLEDSMYYRPTSERSIVKKTDSLLLLAGQELFFNTYYNIFSISKWLQYTRVNSVSLSILACGKAKIEIYQQKASSSQRELLESQTIEAEGVQPVIIPFSHQLVNEDGIIYFKITSISDFYIYSCAYTTAEDMTLNPVCLALNICTFKREADLKRNLTMLQETIFSNQTTMLYGNVEVFVTDNASSLDIDALSNEFIHVVHNKNVGGSGGFTRGLIEILNTNQETAKFTHTIFMDDDIIFDVSALERTYILLQLLKPEYKDACIGGAMLRRDMPHIMNECGATWNGSYGEPIKQGLDLREFTCTLESEKKAKIQYQGWWYCCFPVTLLTEKQLPLPLFIHCDDIEYSLRLFKNIITLNGICVWHEAFNQKRVAFLEYYDLRNALIMNAVQGVMYTKKQCKSLLLHHVIKNIFQLHYQDTMSNFRAVGDFCSGVDWLKQQDGELLHQEIMQLGYIKAPTTELVQSYLSIKRAEKFVELPVELSGKHKLKYMFTLNGWIMPSKYKLKAPASLSEFRNYYRVKAALVYFDNNTGYIVRKNWKEAFNVLKQYFRMCKVLNKNYDKAKAEYYDRRHELTSIAFWKGYLNI